MKFLIFLIIIICIKIKNENLFMNDQYNIIENNMQVNYSCNGVDSKDPGVCFGHGICFPNSTCLCTDKYDNFSFCLIPICFEYSDQDPRVCSGRGRCRLPDTCFCKGIYNGSNCEISFCFDYNSTNPEGKLYKINQKFVLEKGNASIITNVSVMKIM
jgi:hypothetical protein